jgi:hypothetical protein
MRQLPEGVEASFHIYCTSDKEGIDIVVSLKGLKALPDEDVDTNGILKTLPEGIADDWRVMTRDEITEYKANEKDEEY